MKIIPILSALLLIAPCAARAQAPALPAPSPEANACVANQTDGDNILTLRNSCDYAVVISFCIDKGSASYGCKPQDAEGHDIGAMHWTIAAHKSMATAPLLRGKSLWQMACREGYAPVLLNATEGDCIASNGAP